MRSVTCFWLYCDFHFNTTIFSLQVPRGSSFSRSWRVSNSQLFYLLHIKIKWRQVRYVVNHTTWCLLSVRILGEDYRTRFANRAWSLSPCGQISVLGAFIFGRNLTDISSFGWKF